MSTLSYTFLPVSRPELTFVSMAAALSKERHCGMSGQTGSARFSKFARPVTVTVSVRGSPTTPTRLSTLARISSCPTAPVKPSGAPSGRGLTSTPTELVVRVEALRKNPPGTGSGIVSAAGPIV